MTFKGPFQCKLFCDSMILLPFGSRKCSLATSFKGRIEGLLFHIALIWTLLNPFEAYSALLCLHEKGALEMIWCRVLMAARCSQGHIELKALTPLRTHG